MVFLHRRVADARLLVFTFLVGCLWTEPGSALVVPGREFIELNVVARVDRPGGTAAWSARARSADSSSVEAQVLAPGACQRPEPPMPGGTESAGRVELTGVAEGALVWDAATRQFASEGPQQTTDPAWGVGSVRWVSRDGRPSEAADALRFGAAPSLLAVVREDDGGVDLRWDVASVDVVEVWTNGPAGELVCGTEAGGVRLPWWAVPTVGGQVVVRSTRTRITGAGTSVVVVARAAFERVIRLDRPSEAADRTRPPPLRVFERSKAPRRSGRPPAPTRG